MLDLRDSYPSKSSGHPITARGPAGAVLVCLFSPLVQVFPASLHPLPLWICRPLPHRGTSVLTTLHLTEEFGLRRLSPDIQLSQYQVWICPRGTTQYLAKGTLESCRTDQILHYMSILFRLAANQYLHPMVKTNHSSYHSLHLVDTPTDAILHSI